MTARQKRKISSAVKLLWRHGFFVAVPGCFDIDTTAAACRFAEDPERFYRDQESEANAALTGGGNAVPSNGVVGGKVGG